MEIFHDSWLKIDFLLLTCVFETFRIVSISSPKLDPTYYLSIPNYSWDAMLRFTNVHLEQISDIEKY